MAVEETFCAGVRTAGEHLLLPCTTAPWRPFDAFERNLMEAAHNSHVVTRLMRRFARSYYCGGDDGEVYALTVEAVS